MDDADKPTPSKPAPKKPSRGKAIAYWAVTLLFLVPMAGGGVGDLLQVDSAKEIFDRLGYPHYLLTILGAAKLAGTIAILVPGMPRLKEWAYAGFTFDVLGAAASHALAGHGFTEISAPLAIFVLLAVSYLLRPASRRL